MIYDTTFQKLIKMSNQKIRKISNSFKTHLHSLLISKLNEINIGNAVSVFQVEHPGMLKRQHSLGIESRNSRPVPFLPSLNSKKLVPVSLHHRLMMKDLLAIRQIAIFQQ
jgi:hypothetical protein